MAFRKRREQALQHGHYNFIILFIKTNPKTLQSSMLCRTNGLAEENFGRESTGARYG